MNYSISFLKSNFRTVWFARNVAFTLTKITRFHPFILQKNPPRRTLKNEQQGFKGKHKLPRVLLLTDHAFQTNLDFRVAAEVGRSRPGRTDQCPAPRGSSRGGRIPPRGGRRPLSGAPPALGAQHGG